MKAFFEYRKAKVAYQTHGKGRAMVLMHGFLGSRQVWKPYIPRLSKKYRLIVLDLPGHGDSECIGYLHHMELLSSVVKELLHHLNIRKAILVGHSLGGYVGLAFAEKFPDAVHGLILINSSARGDSRERKKSRDQFIALVKKNKSRAIQLLVPSFFGIKKRNTHWLIKGYLRQAERCTEQSIIATVEGMKKRKEREIVLKFAPFPYHFVIGEHDGLLIEQDLIEQAQLNEKGSFELVPDASHMSLLEKEEKVYRAIALFAKGL